MNYQNMLKYFTNVNIEIKLKQRNFYETKNGGGDVT